MFRYDSNAIKSAVDYTSFPRFVIRDQIETDPFCSITCGKDCDAKFVMLQGSPLKSLADLRATWHQPMTGCAAMHAKLLSLFPQGIATVSAVQLSLRRAANVVNIRQACMNKLRGTNDERVLN